MRLLLPALLLIAAGIVAPAMAAPPLPGDIQPIEWTPDPELKGIVERITEVGGEEEHDAYLEEIEATLERHPDWLDLHRFYLAVASRMEGSEDIHAGYLARAEKDSTNPDLLYLRGLLERGANSLTYYRKALTYDPGHYHALCGLGLGIISLEAVDVEEGYRTLFDAVRSRPDHPYGYQTLAIAYGKIAKDYERAIEVCRLWRVVEPESAQPIDYEIQFLQNFGRISDALTVLEEFSREHPDNAPALRMLVGTYKTQNRIADAAATQIELAKLVAHREEEAYQAAVLLANGMDHEPALDWLLEAARRGFDNRRRAMNEPAFRSVHDDPIFLHAIEEMERVRQTKVPALRAKTLAEMIDKPAPLFTVLTLDGKEVSLEKLRGQVTVLDFWATWCGPCRMTLPLVQDLHESLQDRPVRILCMNVWERDRGRVKVVPYWKENRYPMEVGLASNEDAQHYGVTGIPALFVIDQKSRIRYQHRGYSEFMDEEVGWVLDELLRSSD